jgi:hypothetical protein
MESLNVSKEPVKFKGSWTKISIVHLIVSKLGYSKHILFEQIAGL